MQTLPFIEFPAGQGGLNRSSNLTLVPPTDLTWVDGITAEQNSWQKEAGATAYNSPALGVQINAAWDFWSYTFVQETLAWLNDGRLVVLGPTGITKTLWMGTAGRMGWFFEAWLQAQYKCVIFCSGADVPQVYANAIIGGVDYQTQTQPIGIPSPDWSGANQPTMGFLQQFRAVYLGYTPHRAYFSSPRGHDLVGPSAGGIGDTGSFVAQLGDSVSLSVYPGEGQKLVGGVSFRQRCYLFKYPRGIYFVDETDPNIQNWQVLKITDAIGMPGPGCATATFDDVIFLDAEGYFHGLSAVRSFNQEEIPQLLPRQIGDFIRTQINLNALNLTRSVFYARKNQLIFALPAVGTTVLNRRLTFDYNYPGLVRILWSSRDVCPALALRRNNQVQEPMIGDTGGTLWRLDQTARDKGGLGYTGQFEHADTFVMGNGVQRANLNELQVTMQPEGNYNLTMEVQGDNTVLSTIAFSMQTPGAPVGSVSLDSDVLAGNTIANVRHRLVGDCHHVKLIGKNSNADENFSVAKCIVRYKPGRVA